MSVPCRDCRNGLEHCHGAVIHHDRFPSECTEPDCDRPETGHYFHLDCAAIGCYCAAAAPLGAMAG